MIVVAVAVPLAAQAPPSRVNPLLSRSSLPFQARYYGGRQDFATTYRNFRGRDPIVGPLLKSRGLDGR